MPEPERTAITLVAALFGLAALWIGVAQAAGRLRGRRIWTTFGIEVLTLTLIFGPVFLGPPWFAIVLIGIGVVCAREVSAAHHRAGEKPDVFAAGFGVALVLLAAAAFGLSTGYTAFIIIAGGILARSVFDGLKARPPAAAGATLMVVLYPGLFLASLLALGSTSTAFGDVFFCYAMVELNDTLGYLIGATFGKRRVFPEVSPNKTLEGLLGGLVLSVAMAPLFHFSVPSLSRTEVFAGAALLAVSGIAGDLVASRLKRAAAIKDFGSFVPTHGGMFDVYDSLIFAAPIFHAYLSFCRAR